MKSNSNSLILRLLAASAALLTALSAFAQTATVRGRVTDPSGQPVAGVTVMISGTSTGTMTDADGRYSISAKSGDTIEFSCQRHSRKGFRKGYRPFQH